MSVLPSRQVQASHMNSDFIVDLSQPCLLQVKFQKIVVVICIDHGLIAMDDPAENGWH